MIKIRIAEIENFSTEVISQLREIASVDIIETEKKDLKKWSGIISKYRTWPTQNPFWNINYLKDLFSEPRTN
jgi:hypothetical protein